MNDTITMARMSLGTYCFTECKSFCCRKGSLKVIKKEANLLTSEKLQENIKNKSLFPLKGGKYLVNLNKGCPALKDFKCTLHNNPERPQICQDFPIFLEGKKVNVSSKCYAVIEGLLYPYINKMKLQGYEINFQKL